MSMARLPAAVARGLAIGMIACLGCAPNASQVTGNVQLDGKPLTTGTVSFHPTASGPVAYGQLDATGKYELSTGTNEGLQPGSYIVTVTATETLPQTDPNAETQVKLLTPARYGNKETSGLTAEVKAGKNEIPFVLQSKP